MLEGCGVGIDDGVVEEAECGGIGWRGRGLSFLRPGPFERFSCERLVGVEDDVVGQGGAIEREGMTVEEGSKGWNG